MKTAFTYWNKRIAPVFDTARQIKVIETVAGRIVCETLETLENDLPANKALRLSELGITTLVCGAISKSLNELVAAYGIQVISFVAGNLKEVITTWLIDDLKRNSSAMPGCRGLRRLDTTGQSEKRKEEVCHERQGLQL